jgi:hypothetical protein
MGLKFLHTAVVLLVLESDGACSSLNGHSARKSAVFVLVWCYKARDDREQDLWRYWLTAGCNKQWCDRASGYGWSSNKCLKGEQWSSDLAVSRTSAKHSDIQSENISIKTLWFSPLTTVHTDVADSYEVKCVMNGFKGSLSAEFDNVPELNVKRCV